MKVSQLIGGEKCFGLSWTKPRFILVHKVNEAEFGSEKMVVYEYIHTPNIRVLY